jgi:hypothetical protein
VSVVSIIGAGPIGASLAHRLLQRGRVPSLHLVDDSASVAAGKLLDMRQAGPVERFDMPASASDSVLSAASSAVIVIADDSASGAWDGDRGLALVQKLLRAGSTAALVFAAPSQIGLVETAHRELGIASNRLIATAPSAIVGAARALAGLELGVSSVQLTVVGRPPSLVIGWSAATADGSLLTDRVPPHRLLAISRALPKLWPSGPYAIASSTAGTVEALLSGSRRLLPAASIVDDEIDARGRAVLLPLELGRGRVLSKVVPSLSPQERTELLSGLR